MSELIANLENKKQRRPFVGIWRNRFLGGIGAAAMMGLVVACGSPEQSPVKPAAATATVGKSENTGKPTPILPPSRSAALTEFTDCATVRPGQGPFSIHGAEHPAYLIKKRDGSGTVFNNQEVRGQIVFVGEEVCVKPAAEAAKPEPTAAATATAQPEVKPKPTLLPDLDDDAEPVPVRDGIGFSQLSPNHQEGWRWRGRTTCAPTSVANILERFGDTSPGARPYAINEEFLNLGIRDDIEASTWVRSGSETKMDALKWLKQKGYKVEEVHDSYVGEHKQFDFNRAKKSLDEKNLLLISGSVNWINAGTPEYFVPASHIMVIVDIDIKTKTMKVLDPWDGLIHDKTMADFATFDFSYAVKPMPKSRGFFPEINWQDWVPKLPKIEDYIPWPFKKAA